MIVKALVGAAITVSAAFIIALCHLATTDETVITPHVSKQGYLDAKRQIRCLADNVYFEAGNQPIEGMKAVAFVTLNRLYSQRWPSDVCEVVYQKTKNPETNQTICQFSWVCEQPRVPNKQRWELAYNVASHVWYRYNPDLDPTSGATYFHATYVRPQWKYNKIVQIGDHIFYK